MTNEAENVTSIIEKESTNHTENTVLGTEKSLWEYFVSCITEKYFCFKGRARRKAYWSFVLFNFLIPFVLSFISGFLVVTGGNAFGIDILSTLVSLAFLIPGYAVLFRRLHDVNFSGWWATLPLLGLLIAVIISGYVQAMDRYRGIESNQEFLSVIIIISGLVFLIPSLVVFVLIFFKSDMKENKYGPVPEGVK